MRRSAATLSSVALIAGLLCTSAFADDDDHRGWRHRGGHEHKEKFWDRGCKVEREFRRDGSYKEERDCGGRRRGFGGPHPYHAPAWGPGWAAPAHGPWSGPYPAAHAPVVEVHAHPPAVVVRPPVIVTR